jgi:hypothetical protein
VVELGGERRNAEVVAAQADPGRDRSYRVVHLVVVPDGEGVGTVLIGHGGVLGSTGPGEIDELQRDVEAAGATVSVKAGFCWATVWVPNIVSQGLVCGFGVLSGSVQAGRIAGRLCGCCTGWMPRRLRVVADQWRAELAAASEEPPHEEYDQPNLEALIAGWRTVSNTAVPFGTDDLWPRNYCLLDASRIASATSRRANVTAARPLPIASFSLAARPAS